MFQPVAPEPPSANFTVGVAAATGRQRLENRASIRITAGISNHRDFIPILSNYSFYQNSFMVDLLCTLIVNQGTSQTPTEECTNYAISTLA
jgi:hypothetical protein